VDDGDPTLHTRCGGCCDTSGTTDTGSNTARCGTPKTPTTKQRDGVTRPNRKAIEVKKLANIARETPTVKGRLGKKQNEM